MKNLPVSTILFTLALPVVAMTETDPPKRPDQSLIATPTPAPIAAPAIAIESRSTGLEWAGFGGLAALGLVRHMRGRRNRD